MITRDRRNALVVCFYGRPNGPPVRNSKQQSFRKKEKQQEIVTMSNIYLPRNACQSRIREAENARQNRLEIVKAYSHGQISRREIFKWGLVTAGGLIAPIGALSPFVQSAHADSGNDFAAAEPSVAAEHNRPA